MRRNGWSGKRVGPCHGARIFSGVISCFTLAILWLPCVLAACTFSSSDPPPPASNTTITVPPPAR
jgi:hypothetical protein